VGKALAAATVMGALALSACNASSSAGPTIAASSARSTPPGARAIDAAAGEFFTQQPLADGQQLPSRAQVGRWLSHSGAPGVPAGAKLTLGVLTPPSGSGPVRVVALSWHQCGPTIGGIVLPGQPAPTPPPPRCTEWVFLNATNGKFVDSTWSE
jgi:hypothetical protein